MSAVQGLGFVLLQHTPEQYFVGLPTDLDFLQPVGVSFEQGIRVSQALLILQLGLCTHPVSVLLPPILAQVRFGLTMRENSEDTLEPSEAITELMADNDY